MAPRAIDARLPASPAKTSKDKHPQVPSKPPSPLTSPQPAPSPRTRDLPSNQRGHVIALKHRARSPTLLAKHSANERSLASPKPAPPLADAPVTPPQPVTHPQPAHALPKRAVNPSNGDATLRGPILTMPTPVALHVRTPISSDGPTAPTQPVRPPSAPTIAPPGGDVAHHACNPTTGALTAPCARTPTLSKDPPIARVVRQPRDLTGLRSDTPNPWGSLSRRHKYSRPPRDSSTLRSGTRNPWGSLHHRHHRSHPTHPHHGYSHPHVEKPSHKPGSHSTLHPHPLPPAHPHPIPVHIFQVIRHPHGISPTKPKITKTIPAILSKIQKNIFPPRCACGNIIPACRPDRRSSDRRFRRRSRRFGIANEDVRYVWGGHL